MARSGLLIALAALSAAGCAVTTTGACQTDADCLDGAKCVEGVCEGGAPPTAQFTPPATVALGATVTLDGTASARGDGSKEGLVFRWTVLQPADVALTTASAPTTSFVAATPHGAYKVQLVVVDRGTASAPVVRDVGVDNSKPVARLAELGTLPRNATVDLDASASSDPDRDILTYDWELTKDPATAEGTLNPGTPGHAQLLTGGEAVTYTIKVTVTDGSLSDTATTVQAIGNTPPSIDPGMAFAVDHQCSADPSGPTCSASGTLSGSVTDSDGAVDASSIAWKLKSAPPASHAAATFTPVGGDGAASSFKLTTTGADPIAGDYEFELSAKDNDGATATKSVVVTVGNRQPKLTLATVSPLVVPHVFDPRSDEFLAVVPLDATLEDPDGDSLTLQWDPMDNLPGARTELETGTGSTATYRIHVGLANPKSLIDGERPLYIANAHVTETNGGRADVSLPIVVENRAPTASAAALGTLAPGHKYGPVSGVAGGPFYSKTYPVTWDVSDPDGDPVDGTWSVNGRPATITGTLNAPQITVYDPLVNITTATFSANVTALDPFGGGMGTGVNLPAMGNRAPTLTGLAAASSPDHAYGVLPGAGASPVYSHLFTVGPLVANDPDGDPLTGTWTATLPAAPSLRIAPNASGAAATSITLYASEPAVVTQPITVTLTLADGGSSVPVSAKFTMGNRPPTLRSASPGNLNPSSGQPVTQACVMCSASFTCMQSKPATQFNTPTGLGAYQPKFDALATDPDGDPIVVAWTMRPNGNANQLLGPVTMDCASNVACPTVTGVGLGAGLLGVPACGGRPPLGTFLEPDILSATATDAIGALSQPIDTNVNIQAGCNPQCG